MKINTLGTLYVVATPIGNLQDITFRAIEVLKSVNCIVAEDTRHSQPLLQHYLVNTPVMTLHEHNEREFTNKLLERLRTGEAIALISDAGTPLISDPGYYLVKEAREAGIRVVPIPGACALIAALSAAGLPTDRFVFEGFLPAKSSARLQRLEAVRAESRTMVFYEAPHRIQELLVDMQIVFGGERAGVIARELTKLFETINSGTINQLIATVDADSNQRRGEMVVIVEGIKQESAESVEDYHRILTILLASLPLKQAVDLTIKITGQKKNTVYDAALKIRDNATE